LNKINIVVSILLIVGLFLSSSPGAEETCVACHTRVSPGQVRDWSISAHAENDITCDMCHGEEHETPSDYHKAEMPDEHICAECHEDQFSQFTSGKHNLGWRSLNAIPATHLAPDELMEGGRGCGGCHNMGIKTEQERIEQQEKGHRYQRNSCDECHTRHSFSKKEAQNPRACQTCHMGYDHPQWEMWSSAKHGTRYFTKSAGDLPQAAATPTCQHCHLPNGTHENHTAWGFFGVRLPLPEDPSAAADRVTIMKALGFLDPETEQPTELLSTVTELDMIRVNQDSWQHERDKIIGICSGCHSENYAREQLDKGDAILQKSDRLMAEAIETVAALYREGIINKPESYPANYPFLLSFMHTNGAQWDENFDQLSFIDQVLLQMFMKHRMRTYQGFFHANPDYAYWYGWAEMTKDLGEIKELARTMRAQHK
jgi:hydroxylamine dehydrogenase